MDNKALDGQNAIRNVMNCFFCMKDKKNCRGHVLQLAPNADPMLKKYEGQIFAICDGCFELSKEDRDYIPHSIVTFVLSEKMLAEGFQRKKKK